MAKLFPLKATAVPHTAFANAPMFSANAIYGLAIDHVASANTNVASAKVHLAFARPHVEYVSAHMTH